MGTVVLAETAVVAIGNVAEVLPAVTEPRDEVLPKPPACAVLGDGSAWIWNTTAELFPQATQILDRYHAKEALHRTTPTIFGATSEGEVGDARNWMKVNSERLSTLSASMPFPQTSRSSARCTSSAIALQTQWTL